MTTGTPNAVPDHDDGEPIPVIDGQADALELLQEGDVR